MNKIVRYTASWCNPCKQLAAVMEKIDFTEEIEVIDIDTIPKSELQRNYIHGVPTLIYYRLGQEIARQTGAMTKDQLETWLEVNRT